MPNRSMPVHKSTDHDFVPPEKYKPSKCKQIPPEILALETIPNDFEPLQLLEREGHLNSLEPIRNLNEEGVFMLLFDDKVVDIIIHCTNTNAERIQLCEAVPNSTTKKRPWEPVNRSEILAYIGIIIYMGIHISPHQEMYWNAQNNAGPLHPSIRGSMSLIRWQQIHRFLHVFDEGAELAKPSSNSTNPNPKRFKAHEKVTLIADIVRTNFRRYWTPSTHLTVDECIEGFCGRSPDTVNIPSKPTPIGYKIWAIGDSGYILDFLFHVKGDGKTDGPQELNRHWLNGPPNTRTFSKTQAVVLELATRLPENGKGHCIWMDNLFTSDKLLRELRDRGIGGAGTVRMSKTKREENEKRRQGQGARVDRDIDLPGCPSLQEVLEDPEEPLRRCWTLNSTQTILIEGQTKVINLKLAY